MMHFLNYTGLQTMHTVLYYIKHTYINMYSAETNITDPIAGAHKSACPVAHQFEWRIKNWCAAGIRILPVAQHTGAPLSYITHGAWGWCHG
jgi:hypothetical protein